MTGEDARAWPPFLRKLGVSHGIVIAESCTSYEAWPTQGAAEGLETQGVQLSTTTAAGLHNLDTEISPAFAAPGDTILLIGAALPALHSIEERSLLMQETLRQLAERRLLRAVVFLPSAVERRGPNRLPSGRGIQWTQFALTEVVELIDLAGPLAQVSCHTPAHAALTRLVDRTGLLAAVTLGRVAPVS